MGGAVQNHPFRNFQLRQLLLPVRDLSLGVGQLLLYIFFCFSYSASPSSSSALPSSSWARPSSYCALAGNPALTVPAPAGAGPGRGQAQGRFAGGNLLFRLQDLFFGGRQLLLTVGQLLFLPLRSAALPSVICAFLRCPTACARCGERRAGRVVGQPAPTPAARWRCPAPPSRGATAVCAAEYSACAAFSAAFAVSSSTCAASRASMAALAATGSRGQPLVLRGASLRRSCPRPPGLRRVRSDLSVCRDRAGLIGGLLAGEVRAAAAGVATFRAAVASSQCGQRRPPVPAGGFPLGNSGLQCFHKLLGRGKLGLRVGQLLLFVVQQGLVFPRSALWRRSAGSACRKLLLLLCQSAGQTFLIGLRLFSPLAIWFFALSSCAWASSSSARPSSSCSSASPSFFRSLCLGVFQLLPGVRPAFARYLF